jgi:hypothetical protein
MRMLVAVGLLVLGSMSVARADVPPGNEGEKPWPTVRVLAPDCETGAFRANTFLRMLDLELLTERMKTANDGRGRPAEITVAIEATVCDVASQHLAIRLRRSDADVEVKRFIELGDVALVARSRALALAVAEQIRQERAGGGIGAKAFLPDAIEPSPAAPERVRPDCCAAANQDAPAGPPPRLGPEFGAAAAYRSFFKGRTSLMGGNLTFSFPLALSWLRGRADVGALATGVDDLMGSANILALSAGFTALASMPKAPALSFGPRVEVGRASVSSKTSVDSATSDDGAKTIVLASLVAGARVPLDSRLAFALDAELGATALGLTVLADDRTLATLRGGFATLRAGLSFAY